MRFFHLLLFLICLGTAGVCHEAPPRFENDLQRVSCLAYLQRILPGMYREAHRHEIDLIERLTEVRTLWEERQGNPKFRRLWGLRRPLTTIRIQVLEEGAHEAAPAIESTHIRREAINEWRSQISHRLEGLGVTAGKQVEPKLTARISELLGQMEGNRTALQLLRGLFRRIEGRQRGVGVNELRDLPLEEMLNRLNTLLPQRINLSGRELTKRQALELLREAHVREKELIELLELSVLLRGGDSLLAQARTRIADLAEADLDVFIDKPIFRERFTRLLERVQAQAPRLEVNPTTLEQLVSAHIGSVTSDRERSVTRRLSGDLTLIEVPLLIGSLRGCAGGDCAIPESALNPNERIFIAMRGGSVAGYVQADMAKERRKNVFYVSDIQGWRMNAADVEPILSAYHQVRAELGVSEISYIRGEGRGQINNENIRSGFAAADARGRVIRITHPDRAFRDENDQDTSGQHSEAILYVPPTAAPSHRVTTSPTVLPEFRLEQAAERGQALMLALYLARIGSQGNVNRVLRSEQISEDQFNQLMTHIRNEDGVSLNEYRRRIRNGLVALGLPPNERFLDEGRFLFSGILNSRDVREASRFRRLPKQVQDEVVTHIIEELKNNDKPRAMAAIAENHGFLAEHSGFRSYLRWLTRNAANGEGDTILAILPHLRSPVAESEALVRAALEDTKEKERVVRVFSQNPHLWSVELVEAATATPELSRVFSSLMISGLSQPSGIEAARNQVPTERLIALLLERFSNVNRRTLESIVSNRNILPLEASHLLKAFRMNDANVVSAISEVAANVNDQTNFEVALRNFLRASHTTNERRAAILRTMSNRPDFERLLEMVPQRIRAGVVREIARRSRFAQVLELARARGVTPEQMAQVDLIAYEHIDFDMAGGRQVLLGSPNAENDHQSDEAQTRITLKKSFQMATTQTTQFEWFLVMGNNPSRFKDGPGSIEVNGVRMQPNRPVENVSWNDTQEFIRRRNDPRDPAYDPENQHSLSTEAQWELAARGGTSTAYSSGETSAELGQFAWFSGNSGNQTHDVAQLRPNQHGLYDMYGNVWEWVHDWYDALPGGEIREPDPTGPTTGNCRVIRGGGWARDSSALRSACRNYRSPGPSRAFLGFRSLRTPRRNP